MDAQKKYNSIMNDQNNLQTNSDIYHQILAVLDEQPGLKAQEIATQLDIDKKHINSALYGSIRDKCGNILNNQKMKARINIPANRKVAKFVFSLALPQLTPC